MKKNHKLTHLMLFAVGSMLLGGCASTPKTFRGPGGITYHEDQDLQKVWLADGFDFEGYDVLYIADTKFQATKRDNEVEIRHWAMQYLQSSLAAAIQSSGVIPSVVTQRSAIQPDKKVLTLEDTIVEYQKGGGGARYFAGLYGAGQPVIRVHGVMSSEGKPLFEFESRRSGDSAAARLFGGFDSDRDIQKNDIDDLAKDLAAFMKRHAQPAVASMDSN